MIHVLKNAKKGEVGPPWLSSFLCSTLSSLNISISFVSVVLIFEM